MADGELLFYSAKADIGFSKKEGAYEKGYEV